MRGGVEVGQTYDFTLKPATLRGWTVVKETKKGFVIEKTSYFKCAHGEPYKHRSWLGKKSIAAAVGVKKP